MCPTWYCSFVLLLDELRPLTHITFVLLTLNHHHPSITRPTIKSRTVSSVILGQFVQEFLWRSKLERKRNINQYQSTKNSRNSHKEEEIQEAVGLFDHTLNSNMSSEQPTNKGQRQQNRALVKKPQVPCELIGEQKWELSSRVQINS